MGLLCMMQRQSKSISVNILHAQKVFFEYNHSLIIFSICSEAVKIQYMLFWGTEERKCSICWFWGLKRE